VPLLTGKDVSVHSYSIEGMLYRSCVQTGMLRGTETWPVKAKNEFAYQ